MLASLVFVGAVAGMGVADEGVIGYPAAGRRDPFVSMREVVGPGGHRTHCGTGLRGFAANELALRGTVRMKGTSTASLLGPDGRTYFARAGQQLCGGVIDAVSDGAVSVNEDGGRTVRLELAR
jgi:hypothetical protein